MEDMAPDGWLLQRCSHNGANFKVSVPDQGKGRPIDSFGTIVLDGSNEDMVQLGNAIPHYNEDTADGGQRSAAQYPEYFGFERDVVAGSVGYDTKHRQDIYKVAYYNRTKGISCHGAYPGQFECYWGDKLKRMSLYFMSDDLAAILPYVLTVPGKD